MVRHPPVPWTFVGRNLWTTRLLPLHLGTLTLLLACIWLGRWQYSHYTGERNGAPLEKPGPALALSAVLTPGQNPSKASVGQPVRATGHYLPGAQLLLPDREAAGRRGYWLLAPLQVDGGAVAAVVRGWVANPAAPEAHLPTGTVTVTGVVQPGEPAHDQADSGLPPGQAAAASPVEFVDSVPADLYTAIVVARGETPAPAAAPTPVELWTHRSAGGAGFRNLAYALQWWLFAGFAIFMWWRFQQLARQDVEAGSAALAEPSAPVPPERSHT